MSDSGLLQKAFRHFRSARMRRFHNTFRITERTRVLDVGGSPLIWEFAAVYPRLTIANIPGALQSGNNPIDQIAADGRLLPFPDQSFDIVFSNSVIEHVGSHADQQAFADEVCRVGRAHWVQTPNRSFPFEMHAMLPLVHYLPLSLRRNILERFTVWELITHPTPDQRRIYVEHLLTGLKLLNATELQALFPGSQLITERLLALPKSLIAVRC